MRKRSKPRCEATMFEMRERIFDCESRSGIH